jgi:hypothetical protein
LNSPAAITVSSMSAAASASLTVETILSSDMLRF